MPLWRLRWRFDFIDKAPRIGIWNGTSGSEKDSAWAVDKRGLKSASIQGEFHRDYIVKTFWFCPGEDYATMKWEGAVNIPGVLGFQGEVKLAPRIIGLSLLSRSERITVFVNGEITKRPINEDEAKFKIYEHSRGV